MQKRFVISIILVLILSLGAFSQYYSGRLSSSFYFPNTQYQVDSLSGQLRFKPGDIGFSMQIGTGVSTNFKGNTSFGTYVSPALAYNVSSRFRIKTGVMVLQNFGDPYFAGYDGYYSPVINPGTTTSLFIQGDYLLSNKLMLSGAVYKDFNTFNANAVDPNYKMPETQGVILNLNYKPASFFEFNVSMEYGNGNHSMLQSPFNYGGMFPGSW